MQAAPATLKAAFLQPIMDNLTTAVATDLFAKTDSEFMDLFVGAHPPPPPPPLLPAPRPTSAACARACASSMRLYRAALLHQNPFS